MGDTWVLALLSIAPPLAAAGLWLLLHQSFSDGKKFIARQRAELQSQLESTANELNAVSRKLAGLHDATLNAVRSLSSNEQLALSHLLSSGMTPTDTIAEASLRLAVQKRIEHLEDVWFSGEYNEDSCTKALCENLWVLQPDLVATDHIFHKRHLSTIADAYFANDQYADGAWKFLDVRREADAAGVFHKGNRVSDDSPIGERVFVLIESKNPDREVNQFVMDEALQYAVNLRKLAKSLMNWDIECIALGASIGPDVRTQLYRFGSTPHTLTVIPMTWRSLLNRAKTLDPLGIVLDGTHVNGKAAPSYLEAAKSDAATRPIESPEPVYEEVI